MTTNSYDMKKSRAKRERNNQTGWKTFRDRYNNVDLNGTLVRVVNYRYTDGRGDVNVWIKNERWVEDDNGTPTPPGFSWAVTRGDTRVRPSKGDWVPVPRDRTCSAEVAWFVEKHFTRRLDNGKIEQLPHNAGRVGSDPVFSPVTKPHPDDAPAGYYTPKEAEDWMRRKRREFEVNGWEWT